MTLAGWPVDHPDEPAWAYDSFAVGTRPLMLAALVIWSAAWLISAACLGLDVLGGLPVRRRRNTRAFRLQSAAGLAMATGAVIFQIAALRDWPRLVRVAVDALNILLALILLISVIIAASINRAGVGSGQ